MFKVHKIGANNLSVKNMVLLFFTIVFGFASVITLAQITIPSVINNAWQTIGRVTITQSGTEYSPLYRDFNYDGNGSTMISGLDEKGPFSGRVLGIDDNGNIIFAYSNNLLVSVSSGYRTGDGTDIRNTNIGNVGIGTDTPNMGKIHIVNSGSTDIYIQELKNGDAASMRLQTQKGTWIVGGDSNPEVFFIGILTGLSLNEQHQEYFTVTPLGNIGIGTTTPTGGRLHILNSGSAEIYLEETKLSGAANIYFKNPERIRTMGGDSDPDYFYIGKINSGADIVITPDSNVGIGLINPTHPFEVYKNSRADVVRFKQMRGNMYFGGVDGEGNASNNLVLKETATDGSASNVISLQGNNGVHGLDISSYTPNGNPQYNTITSKGGLLIGISTGVGTRDDLGISFVTQSNQYRLKITSGGNVGIGTTNPTNKLEVTGTGQFNGLKVTSLISEDCLGTDSAGNVIGTGCGGGGGNSYRQPNANGIHYTGTNVGIGTANPSIKLEINGNVLAKGTGNYDAAGDTATLFLGDTNAYIRAAYGLGLRFGTFSNPDILAITHGGSVGIGTINPANKLHVTGTGQFSGLRITSLPSEDCLGTDSAGNVIGTGCGGGGGGSSYWNANGSNIYNSNAGKVGIGTASPTAGLQVSGNAIFGGVPANYSDTPASIVKIFANSSMSENPNRTAVPHGLVLKSTNTALSFGVDPNFQEAYIIATKFGGGLDSNSHLIFNPGDYGNVGIGTTGPVERLEVDGNIRNHGTDFKLGDDTDGRGDPGNARALVHNNGNILTMNYAGDYTGGIKLDSKVGIQIEPGTEALTVNGNIQLSSGYDRTISIANNSTGNANNLNIVGSSTASNGNGGDINIIAGNGYQALSVVSSYGGDIRLTAGKGLGFGGNAGNIYLDTQIGEVGHYGDIYLASKGGNISIGNSNYVPRSKLDLYNLPDSDTTMGSAIRINAYNSSFEMYNGNPTGQIGILQGFRADYRDFYWGIINRNTYGATSVTWNMKLESNGDLSISNGDVYANAYYYLSDKRLKTDITPIEDPLEKILALNGYLFTWKNDGKRDIGVIAQEVEKIFPEAVSTNKEGYKSVEYGNLVAPLIEAIKELNAKVEAQGQEIENLKLKIKN